MRLATVLHVIERYLELSAGFVHGQLSRSRHRGVVLSRLDRENLAAFPHAPVRQVPAILQHLPEPARRRTVALAVLAHARWARADLAHAHFGYALPDVSILAKRLGLPTVVSLHGHDVTAWPRDQPNVFPYCAPFVSAAIVPSRWLANVVVGLGISEERIHVIPAGIDTRLFVASPLPPHDGGATALTVAFVGRFVEKKGLDVLLRAWPSVLAAVPDARLRLLGAGPLEPQVERIAAERGSRVERVVPDPARRGEQVRDLLSAATVVATPSHTAANGDSESLLLVNLEAQASGRAVVTTRHGGIPEFVAEGESALVVPEGDPAALGGALVRVLADPDLARRLGAAGPAVAGRFDAADMAARVDDVYDALLDDRSLRRRRAGSRGS